MNCRAIRAYQVWAATKVSTERPEIVKANERRGAVLEVGPQSKDRAARGYIHHQVSSGIDFIIVAGQG